jgi:uncharacterized iron-regulated membrane protein
MLRRLHRTVALVFSPVFIITAVTGAVLLWRKAGVYGEGPEKLMLGLHNWEMAARYVGIILAAGLLLVVITGICLAVQIRRSKPRAEAPGPRPRWAGGWHRESSGPEEPT